MTTSDYTKMRGVTEKEFCANLPIDQPVSSTQDGSLLRVELTCLDTG
jgi:hypothetical protein